MCLRRASAYANACNTPVSDRAGDAIGIRRTLRISSCHSTSMCVQCMCNVHVDVDVHVHVARAITSSLDFTVTVCVLDDFTQKHPNRTMPRIRLLLRCCTFLNNFPEVYGWEKIILLHEKFSHLPIQKPTFPLHNFPWLMLKTSHCNGQTHSSQSPSSNSLRQEMPCNMHPCSPYLVYMLMWGAYILDIWHVCFMHLVYMLKCRAYIH